MTKEYAAQIVKEYAIVLACSHNFQAPKISEAYQKELDEAFTIHFGKEPKEILRDIEAAKEKQ